jgi:methionyl-tRNA synthetase
MTDHCDKCGTTLDPEEPRHQRFVFEAAEDDTETLVGAMCSDCFFEFEEWLATREAAEAS